MTILLFSGIPFLYGFFPAVILVYFIAPNRLKNAVLLVASLFFYAWGEQGRTLVLLFSITLGWILSLAIEKTRGSRWSRFFLCFSVLSDLYILGYFKYADFFLFNLGKLFSLPLPQLQIALPIGISFYTFQLLSYTIDVYRGDVSAQRNPVTFAAYVALFPQLIAGPIVRYADIEEQLANRTHSISRAVSGLRRFLFGLGKKVLLANVLGELCSLYRQTSAPSVLFCWMYAVSFSLQIYFDFSGYSDMAIGLGKLFGFDFMENFNYPYISRSITEFWRRWHISLGSWFRDYVYIPMGGNRRGTGRQLLGIFVVWMLTGFWHGAAWNFIFWGIYYALLLLAEKLLMKNWLARHPVFGHCYVIFATLTGFLLFNASDLAQAGSDLLRLFAFGRLPLVSAESLYDLRSYAMIIILAVFGATPLPKQLVDRLMQKASARQVLRLFEPAAMAGLLLVVTAYLVDGSFNPFLYFRF